MFKSRKIATSGTGFQDRSSFVFDRDNDRLAITETTYDVHDSGDKFSFSFWYKRSAYDWDRVIGDINSTTNSWILLGDETTPTSIYLECDTNGKTIRTDGAEGKLNTWYHIVVTTDGAGSGAFYENGKPLALTVPGSMNAGLTINHIGKLVRGWMNDVAIYNTDIGAAGANELYNNREPFNHKEGSFSANLINWWRMGDGDGDSSTTIKDQAGSLDGTVTDDAHITGDVPW